MATDSVEETHSHTKLISSLLKQMRQLPGNKLCADCQECICPQCSIKDPQWLSDELQIIVCSECKAIHERVTDVTFRSVLAASDWSKDSIQRVKNVSNEETNKVYERELPPAFRKPTRCFDWRFREHWIRSKYIKKYFKDRSVSAPRYLWGDKSGYLWKRGRDDCLFMRRWFVLDIQNEPLLKYYADADEMNLKGEIPLMGLDLCLTTEEKTGYPNAMQIFCKEGRAMDTRVIYLYSETAKELVEWYQAVRIRKFYELLKRDPHKNLHLLRRGLGNDILHEGYLLKTGRKGTETFRRRWFVLHGRHMHYFGDPLDARPKGTISLDAEGISVILSGQRDKNGYHFKLKTPGRVYPLVAEEEHQRDVWIKAIHQSCYQDAMELTKAASKSATLPIRMSADVTELAAPRARQHKTLPLPTTPRLVISSDSDSPLDEADRPASELVLNYVYLQNGTVLANEEWDPTSGLVIKGEVAMVKILPGGLNFPPSVTAEVTITIQKIDLCEAAKSKDYGDMALAVCCEGSPSDPEVKIPMELELYHCGVLTDCEKVEPLLWYLDDGSWVQASADDDRFSCEVMDHTFSISSRYFGSLMASMQGEGVIGKRMRCAAFCCSQENSENLEIVVYIFNNHVSNFLWKLIEVNETTNSNSTLLDISNEFRVLKENKTLLLSIETIKGFQLMPGNFTTLTSYMSDSHYVMRIPFEDIWSKTYDMYHLELIQTAKNGECQLVLSQELPDSGPQLATLNLKNNVAEMNFEDSGAHPGKLERRGTPHPLETAGLLDPPPIPSRGHSLDTAPSGTTQAVNRPHFFSERTTSKDEEATLADAALLPFSVKQDLAKALDLAPVTKNWRAFAIEMGVNQTECDKCLCKVSPTMEVFKYCEYLESTLSEVKEAVRYIGNEDALDILAKYLMTD